MTARLECNIEVNQAKMDANLKEMREKIESGQAEMRSTFSAFQEKLEGNTKKMEPNLEMMQSIVEHQEVPMEEAAVKSPGAMKKWHRGRNLATRNQRKGPSEIVDPR
jgi:single-stranded DNA-specific DHH superfamily exonuclease